MKIVRKCERVMRASERAKVKKERDIETEKGFGRIGKLSGP